jgi:hypothetical protein
MVTDTKICNIESRLNAGNAPYIRSSFPCLLSKTTQIKTYLLTYSLTHSQYYIYDKNWHIPLTHFIPNAFHAPFARNVRSSRVSTCFSKKDHTTGQIQCGNGTSLTLLGEYRFGWHRSRAR